MFDYEDDAFEAGFVDGLVKEAGRKKKPGMFAKGWRKVKGHLKRNKAAYLAGAGGLAAGALAKHMYDRSQEKDAYFADDDFYFDGESAIEKIAKRGKSKQGWMGRTYGKVKRHVLRNKGAYLAGAGGLAAGALAKHMYDKSQEKDAYFADDDFYFDGESAIEKIAKRRKSKQGWMGRTYGKVKRHVLRNKGAYLAGAGGLAAGALAKHLYNKSQEKDASFYDSDLYFDGESAIEKIAKRRKSKQGWMGRTYGKVKRHLKKHRGAYLAGAGGLAAGALAKHMYDKYRSED